MARSRSNGCEERITFAKLLSVMLLGCTEKFGANTPLLRAFSSPIGDRNVLARIVSLVVPDHKDGMFVCPSVFWRRD